MSEIRSDCSTAVHCRSHLAAAPYLGCVGETVSVPGGLEVARVESDLLLRQVVSLHTARVDSLQSPRVFETFLQVAER